MIPAPFNPSINGPPGSALRLNRLLGFKPGDAVAQFAHNLLARHNLTGSKLCLAAGKGFKPSGRGRTGDPCAVHLGTISTD